MAGARNIDCRNYCTNHRLRDRDHDLGRQYNETIHSKIPTGIAKTGTSAI
jgi:hypothetical protein